MDHIFKGMNDEASDCPFDENDILKCPFLRNINKPTSFSFSAMNFSIPLRGDKGPIFEDAPSFDVAFKLFHGKNGVVPLSEISNSHNEIIESDPVPAFNPLAAKAATISLSAFGPGGPFSFGSFSDKWKKQKKAESSSKREPSSQKGNSSKHESLGNEWLESGNCPIAKSYRAVGRVLPLVATAFQPPPGMKLKCPPAVVTARAALARTTFVKNLRPQPLPAKMLVIAALGMAVNVPLGVWREHTRKFSLSWFAAVHAAVPFIAMLRKSVLMPKTAMAMTIAASILGQVIGSRAERIRLKSVVEMEKATPGIASKDAGYNLSRLSGITNGHCGAEGMVLNSLPGKDAGSTSSSANMCF
ncbi:Zinc finger B-box domain containing protein 1 isoform 1 [Quillaja saponaria]|uniref:Zinc finger B-box domain containing protein 1 isoform 1 n=1 Tax=Quillaja saponaria TaxID=32244 RepID=A0AAD7KQ59_QUISA|nr:Zinc finger B-box domain containing protein 1 isoform 1 [Quillaja saponaria]